MGINNAILGLIAFKLTSWQEVLSRQTDDNRVAGLNEKVNALVVITEFLISAQMRLHSTSSTEFVTGPIMLTVMMLPTGELFLETKFQHMVQSPKR